MPLNLQREERSSPDSIFAAFTSIQTGCARFILWVNIPGCYLVLLSVLTGHAESWKASLLVEQQRHVSYVFGFFGAWLFIVHLFGIPGAWMWELWWNPYARYPSLKGRADPVTSQRLAEENRAIVRYLLQDVFGEREREVAEQPRR